MKLFAVFAFIFLSLSAFAASPTLKTVEYVEPARYMGTWYEIARYENRFQKDCYATKVNYALRDNGTVAVTNTCTLFKNPQETTTANGIAFIADKETNSKLEVGFAPLFKYLGWFTGDYWIMKLGANYEYAVIGTPNYKYFWIIAREKQISEALYQELIDFAVEQGFDAQKIIKSSAWELK